MSSKSKSYKKSSYELKDGTANKKAFASQTKDREVEHDDDNEHQASIANTTTKTKTLKESYKVKDHEDSHQESHSNKTEIDDDGESAISQIVSTLNSKIATTTTNPKTNSTPVDNANQASTVETTNTTTSSLSSSTFKSTTGNESFTATAGNDVFVFPSKMTGKDTISGFDPQHDVLQFGSTTGQSVGNAGIHNTNYVLQYATFDSGSNVVIYSQHAGSTITLLGIHKADLSDANFDFTY